VSGDLVALPKAHLHVHLESAIRPSTLVSLGGAAPPAVFAGFGAFVDYNAAVRACLRTAADFERVAYEFCVDSAADGVRCPTTVDHRLDTAIAVDPLKLEPALRECALRGHDAVL